MPISPPSRSRGRTVPRPTKSGPTPWEALLPSVREVRLIGLEGPDSIRDGPLSRSGRAYQVASTQINPPRTTGEAPFVYQHLRPASDLDRGEERRGA